MSTKKEVVNRWFQKVWVEGDLAAIDEIYTPGDAKNSLRNEGIPTTNEVLELAIVLRRLINNNHVRILKSLEVGNWIALAMEMEGSDAATGNPIKMQWQTMMRIENGCIIENHPSVNFMSLFEQLGQLPESCFELMLAGTTLK